MSPVCLIKTMQYSTSFRLFLVQRSVRNVLSYPGEIDMNCNGRRQAKIFSKKAVSQLELQRLYFCSKTIRQVTV